MLYMSIKFHFSGAQETWHNTHSKQLHLKIIAVCQLWGSYCKFFSAARQRQWNWCNHFKEQGKKSGGITLGNCKWRELPAIRSVSDTSCVVRKIVYWNSEEESACNFAPVMCWLWQCPLWTSSGEKAVPPSGAFSIIWDLEGRTHKVIYKETG